MHATTSQHPKRGKGNQYERASKKFLEMVCFFRQNVTKQYVQRNKINQTKTTKELKQIQRGTQIYFYVVNLSILRKTNIFLSGQYCQQKHVSD